MKRMMILMLLLLMVGVASMNAQVTIGSASNPNPSAVLDLNTGSTGYKGLLLPNVPLTGSRDNTTITNPATGLMVYATGTAGLSAGVYVWDGGKWKVTASDCPFSLTDIDGNTYSVKLFGDQCWMTQNLRVTRTPGGTPLDSVRLNPGIYSGSTNHSVSVGYNASASSTNFAVYTPGSALGTSVNYTENGIAYTSTWNDFGSKFGFLYPSYLARSACPMGWHLPSGDEFLELSTYLGSKANKKALDNNGTIVSADGRNTTSSGYDRFSDLNARFNVLLGGYVTLSGSAFNFTYAAYLTEQRIENVQRFDVGRDAFVNTTMAYVYKSVRCLKD
jgi:uncharacterized protein (TIGR02145 family)